MSRDFAPIYTSIWNDDDFRALLPQQQHMYFLLISQHKISYCGVLDWLPSRLTRLAAGITRPYIDTHVNALADAGYLILDPETAELLVRSFIRWDGLIKMERPAKAIAKDWRGITSDTIRNAVLTELRRVYTDNPDHAGWIGIRKQDPDLLALIVQRSAEIRAVS